VPRLLLADPLLVFRVGVRRLLESEPGLEVVEASDADGVARALDGGAVDLALLDLRLPPEGALPVARRLAASSPGPVIVWSFEPEAETVVAAIHAGASGYLRKETPSDGLLRALRAALAGEVPLPRAFAEALVHEIHGFDERARARERAAVLSARELEVLELVAGGASNREVAGRLYISESTAKRHVQNILRKLRVESRGAAARFYRAAF
jgi:DNA-binding NarL/FixJ family response regulator